MGDTKVYDASEVSIVAFGIPINAGYADGEFVRIEQQEDQFTLKMGTDGEGTRSKTNNNSAKITIRLMQSSSSNAALSAVYLTDKLGTNGAGIGPLLVKDRQGTSLHTASKAWITKLPDSSYDKEATVREWVLMTTDLKSFIGGN